MRLISTDIPVEDLEAAKANLGQPGDVVEDDDLDSARTEVDRALDAAEHGDGTYEDRLVDAIQHTSNALDHLDSFNQRVTAVHAAGGLRVGNSTAASVLAATASVMGALDEWSNWAHNELRNLD